MSGRGIPRQPPETAKRAPLRVAITGSGGYLAQQLITRVALDAGCEFILGLDIRPRAPQVRCAVEFLRFDLT